jgi:hypothetical protein
VSDVVWGYCHFCNKEVEVRGGRLIHHLETYQGARCPGSGRPPSAPPREGAWWPPRRAVTPVPDPVVQAAPAAAAAATTLRTWRDVIRGLGW